MSSHSYEQTTSCGRPLAWAFPFFFYQIPFFFLDSNLCDIGESVFTPHSSTYRTILWFCPHIDRHPGILCPKLEWIFLDLAAPLDLHVACPHCTLLRMLTNSTESITTNRLLGISKNWLIQVYVYVGTVGFLPANPWSTDVDFSVFISYTWIAPENELFTVKYAFNLETPIYLGTWISQISVTWSCVSR